MSNKIKYELLLWAYVNEIDDKLNILLLYMYNFDLTKKNDDFCEKQQEEAPRPPSPATTTTSKMCDKWERRVQNVLEYH